MYQNLLIIVHTANNISLNNVIFAIATALVVCKQVKVRLLGAHWPLK